MQWGHATDGMDADSGLLDVEMVCAEHMNPSRTNSMFFQSNNDSTEYASEPSFPALGVLRDASMMAYNDRPATHVGLASTLLPKIKPETLDSCVQNCADIGSIVSEPNNQRPSDMTELLGLNHVDLESQQESYMEADAIYLAQEGLTDQGETEGSSQRSTGGRMKNLLSSKTVKPVPLAETSQSKVVIRITSEQRQTVPKSEEKIDWLPVRQFRSKETRVAGLSSFTDHRPKLWTGSRDVLGLFTQFGGKNDIYIYQFGGNEDVCVLLDETAPFEDVILNDMELIFTIRKRCTAKLASCKVPSLRQPLPNGTISARQPTAGQVGTGAVNDWSAVKRSGSAVPEPTPSPLLRDPISSKILERGSRQGDNGRPKPANHPPWSEYSFRQESRQTRVPAVKQPTRSLSYDSRPISLAQCTHSHLTHPQPINGHPGPHGCGRRSPSVVSNASHPPLYRPDHADSNGSPVQSSPSEPPYHNCTYDTEQPLIQSRQQGPATCLPTDLNPTSFITSSRIIPDGLSQLSDHQSRETVLLQRALVNLSPETILDEGGITHLHCGGPTSDAVVDASQHSTSLSALSTADNDVGVSAESDLPEDVKHLVKAARSSAFIYVIISRSMLASANQAILLPDEYGYIWLGKFRLHDDVKVTVETDDTPSTTVAWRFTSVLSHYMKKIDTNPLQPLYPWWMAPSNASTSGTYVHDHVSFILPELMNPAGLGERDAYFLKGWLCSSCGRVNAESMMRHRKCPSFECQDRPISSGYARSIDQVRGIGECCVVYLPNVVFPEDLLKSSLSKWDDGMLTFLYASRDRVQHSIDVWLLFASNEPELQQDASGLFTKLQTEVPLVREDNSPFFSAKATNLDGFQPSEPRGAARNYMVEQVRTYAEIADFEIASIEVVGWVTSSNAKGGYRRIRAKTKPAAIACLGAEVVVHIASTSVATTAPRPNECSLPPAPEQCHSTGNLDGPNDKAGVNFRLVEVEDDEPNKVSIKAKRKRCGSPLVSLTMYHGDILVLSGDEFELTMQRTGTTLILIGSNP